MSASADVGVPRTRWREIRRLVSWVIVALLVGIGVASAVGRAVFREDLASRVDPVRRRVLAAFRVEDPLESLRARELDRFDGRFAAASFPTLLHVLPGAVFLILAPLQFSSRIRTRHIRFHRWTGRLLLIAGFTSVAAGFYFGLRMPYGGAGEVTAIVLFGGVFAFALARAFVAIRRGEVSRHRRWMIRAFAIAIGISMVRVVGAALDLALTPAGIPPAAIFALSLWIGWGMSLGVGELWISRSAA